jgi:hypothetical protein
VGAKVLLFAVAYTLLIVALAVAHARLNSHVEKELKGAGGDAAFDYVKAGRFPRLSQPVKPDKPHGPDIDFEWLMRQQAGSSVRIAARHAYVALPADIDAEAASEELDTAVEKAKSAWRSDHGGELTALDVLDVLDWSGWALIEGMPKILNALALYLSLPFRIALGLGFGVALGAWIIKKLSLGGIWR